MKINDIIFEIEDYLLTCDYELISEFYIGITNDAERRLFYEHNVDEITDDYIYLDTLDTDLAMKVESYFLGKGMKGGSGGGIDDTTYVYCYKITENTKE